MSSNDSGKNFKSIKIPQLFYSEATNKPFAQCIYCGKDLLIKGTRYAIEKAFKKYINFNTYDVIFEYAICFPCQQELHQSFSESSRKNLYDYFNKNVDWMKRSNNLLRQNKLTVDSWIDRCVIKGTPIDELTEYQIACECDGENLIFTFLPYMVSSHATDEIINLLSNKTLDGLSRFKDEKLALPPEIQDILKDQPILFI